MRKHLIAALHITLKQKEAGKLALAMVADATDRRDQFIATRFCGPKARLRTALSFFFIDTAPPEIYTLSLHDALPICLGTVMEYAFRDYYMDRQGHQNLGELGEGKGGVFQRLVDPTVGKSLKKVFQTDLQIDVDQLRSERAHV